MERSTERSADKFALLEQRMSFAAHAGHSGNSHDGFAPPLVQQSIGFSASRECSQPGASPQGTPNSAVKTGGPAPQAFASLASGLFKRRRSPTGSDAAGEPLPGSNNGFHVRTPSPSFDGAAHLHGANPSSGGVATHSPPAGAIGFTSMTHSAALQQELQKTQQELREVLQRAEQAEAAQRGIDAELATAGRLLGERDEELGRTRAALRAEENAASTARSELDLAKTEVEASRGAIEGMRKEIEEIRTEQEAETARQAKGRVALREALRERCFRERAATKERLARESVRLGTLEADTKAFGAGGGWVQRDGTALVQLHERERHLELRRAALEDDRKALRKRRTGNAAAGEDAAEVAMELADREESLNLRASLLAKERTEVQAERRQLEREAMDHFHELRLMSELAGIEPELRMCPSYPADGGVYEPGAPLSADPAASAQRFVFLDLIAQGGFACVFKTYDLQRHEYTACKLHRMSEGWADARKEAFVRHVEREMEITVGVRHHRIVDTYAAFEVSSNTVVSVMPYCNGGSLADLLRKHGPLPEKDAKSIMLQLLCGLRHLHSRPDPIIHYDLKPANILFHDDEVKLSDFGLSKVMAGGPASRSQPGMELTSYGSGTHGYLPPECYDGDASRVCPKVDIFSAGVVHYVMLFFPTKPFFKQATQQQIMAMKSHTIRQETQTLEFPGKLSAEAQAFLRRALTSRRDERPNVVELLADPYMQPKAVK